MKLSNGTVTVLKNFSTINQNLVIKAGNKISTMSAMKNIIAKATVEETFPREIAIYDGPDGETYIEKRGTGYYGYNNEFDFTAEDKAELKHKLNSWGYRLVAGSIDESVNEQLSIISKSRAKSSLRQIKSGKRDDGMGKFDAKLYGVDSDGKEHEIKNENDLSKYQKFGLRSEALNEQPEQWTQLDIININKSLRLTLKTFNNLINNIERLEAELSKHQNKPQGDLLQKMMPDSFDYMGVQNKLHKLYNAFSNAFSDALNEDLTIGGKKVKKIHKNDSNNPKDHTIEYEDGSTEPYLDHLKEEEVDEGEGIGYMTPDAFDKNKKSTGARDIYYYKLGYKPVPKKIKDSGMIVKQLFEKEELTEYSDFQQKRINAFDELEEKFNQVSPLLSSSKSETAKFYNENPGSYAIAYSTDMVDSYVDNIIELLKQSEE